MTRNRLAPLSSLLALFLALTLVVGTPGWGQQYRFQVERMELQVWIQPDASAKLRYEILFANQGKPIDIVDIGLPHPDYDLRTMSASIGGTALRGIKKSTYIDTGVEIPLGKWAIGQGRRRTFVFTCTMPDMVYQDTTSSELASFQIIPTWFDPQLQQGTTRLDVAIHLPPGVEPGEVRYQDESLRYQDLVREESDEPHVVALYSHPDHRLSRHNPKFGISFPRDVMSRVVQITIADLIVRWLERDENARAILGILLVTLFSWFFFRFSGGTGFVLYFLLLAGLVVILVKSVAIQLLLWPLFLVLLVVTEVVRHRQRRTGYLPALASVEGGGIKRGLTAPEAAVLLELPLKNVLTLVLIGLLKKGVARLVSDDPLEIEIEGPFKEDGKKRRKAAADRGIVLHPYEQPFIDTLAHATEPTAKLLFGKALTRVVRSVVGKMKGFDRDRTRAYYRRIVDRAVKETEGLPVGERMTETLDRNLEWILLDEKTGRRGRPWIRSYYPVWACPASSGGGRSGGSSPPSVSAPSRTTGGEVAGSVAGWFENTASRLATAIEPGSVQVGAPRSGLMDLSGIDRVTAEVFESLGQSSGGGGGGGWSGGGGCACACAGCACACACAGGGR